VSKWTRTHTFVAGMVLILATNAVALLGVVYNRGEAESTLNLTERELHLPYNWGFEKENSGIALRLQWRTLAEEPERFYGLRRSYYSGYTGFGSEPKWLDRAKLAALGFDVSKAEDTPQGEMHYAKSLAMDVLLVLEFDGPAHGIALSRAQQHLQNEEALLKTNLGKKEFEERAKNARQALYQEERINTRLFVIDAGCDAASLRAQYPDRHRYAIVRGQVQPRLVDVKNKPIITAYISGISNAQVNVPAVYRPFFEPLQERVRTNQYDAAVSPYKVTVAFGQRLEPWITEATAAK
jgi:hypothetical protein